VSIKMWRSQGVFLGALSVFLKLGPAVAQTNITISPAAQAACQAILVAGVETLTSEANYLYPEYIYAQSHYWSAANADLIPACAVFPTTAQQVSQIVTVLNESPGVGFSVKSGGHNPNVGFSSTDGGVLISMQNISSTVLSTDQTKAYVGTGSRWVAVAEALEPYNLTVVSGRIGM
jgi:FAD/FMN-containing dehydrogenase